MKVHVVGGDNLVEGLFKKKNFQIVGLKKIEEANIVVFTGGADVDPTLYGEQPLEGTHCDYERDEEEITLFESLPKEVLRVGICRGGQFLNVMNGGRLYQDVNNHAGRPHECFTPSGVSVGQVTSTHHQMMIPSVKGDVLLVASISTKRHRARGEFVSDPFTDDCEVVVYKNTEEGTSICFQPHPEYQHSNTARLFWETLKIVSPEVKDFLEKDKEKEKM